MTVPPDAAQVADRALVLYAVTRRGTIEFVVDESGGAPDRVRQAEGARAETERWLEREHLADAVLPAERSLLDAPSGSWPREAVTDAMWRKEALGIVLWSLGHLDRIPDYGSEFDQHELDRAITRYGTVVAFRENGVLRSRDEIDRAWLEADAWFGATEGRVGDDASVASIAAERFRALSWLRDAGGAPA